MNRSVDYKESSRTSIHEIPHIAYRINQILKGSEINKHQATEHMVGLFEKVGMNDMSYDFCKQLIEEYLKDPFLRNTDLE